LPKVISDRPRAQRTAGEAFCSRVMATAPVKGTSRLKPMTCQIPPIGGITARANCLNCRDASHAPLALGKIHAKAGIPYTCQVNGRARRTIYSCNLESDGRLQSTPFSHDPRPVPDGNALIPPTIYSLSMPQPAPTSSNPVDVAWFIITGFRSFPLATTIYRIILAP
jgi:hypothetical protein